MAIAANDVGNWNRGAGRRVLLAGASGVVGRALAPALTAAGWQVRCMTRDLERGRRLAPDLDWAQADVADHAACLRALGQCEAAVYLVHNFGEGPEYVAGEVEGARTFARAAATTGLGRIVYLGTIAPAPGVAASDHLRSRLAVGEALREGSVPALELRASMIVGLGSAGFRIVRDLAARLPVMVLPRWLQSKTEPVAIDDVIVALLRALDLPLKGSAWFDLPGPEALTGREMLERTAAALHVHRPMMVELPLLTPQLSSRWVSFVTRAEPPIAREIVVGLTHDLLATDDRFWGAIGHPHRIPFEEAAQRAIAREEADARPDGMWGIVERVRL